MQKSTIIYCLNGPNLNLLGQREPELYGRATLEEIARALEKQCSAAGAELIFRQTNSEGRLVDHVQEAGKSGSGLLLNAAAYTHSSIALHDALRALDIPLIEIHLTNPAARESFRHVNYVSSCAIAVVAGLGARSYEIGMEAMLRLCSDQVQG